jgi:EAL and modified HD-GYP domain-containing signal transduction protein
VEVYVGRQAVFDRRKSVAAYELLFRAARDASTSSRSDALASYEVIHNTFLDIGLHRLLNGVSGLLNLPRDLILDPRIRALPKDTMKLEILETVTADEDVLEACEELKGLGYTLVLDDYTGQPESEPFLKLVDWVKVDFRALDPGKTVQLARKLSGNGKTPLAEKVETQQEFDHALKSGYHLFQGFFLQRPAMLSAHTVASDQLHTIRLLQMLAAPEIDIDKLERVISQDVGLSYKLLRYANSAKFGLRQQFSSILEAMVWLGADEIRRIVTLAVLPKISSGQNPELTQNALIRARMCSQIARLTGQANQQEKAFLTGLFSLLDAIMRAPMPGIVEELSLADDLAEALLDRGGADSSLGQLLRVVKSYETAAWDELAEPVSRLHLGPTDLVNIYFDALRWSKDEV